MKKICVSGGFSLDFSISSTIILNNDDYINICTDIDEPVKIVVCPLGCNKQNIDGQELNKFNDFIDSLEREKNKPNQKIETLKTWVEKLGEESFVNSLAFCLLTGRRFSKSDRDRLNAPYVTFNKKEEKSINDEESSIFEDIDLEDIDLFTSGEEDKEKGDLFEDFDDDDEWEEFLKNIDEEN